MSDEKVREGAAGHEVEASAAVNQLFNLVVTQRLDFAIHSFGSALAEMKHGDVVYNPWI